MISKDISEKDKKENEGFIMKNMEIFADPTLDVSFKMLFGQNKNKEILISLVNSLLSFKGKDTIVDIEINPSELVVSNISNEKGETGITSTVDLLCTNVGKQQIAIEMQGQKTKYFLIREQEYMAKLISGQVKEGQGKKYHEKVLDTYVVVIAKNDMFVGNTAIKDQTLFEIDVKPMILQTNEIYPGNKMHWKFFELSKFKESNEYAKIKEYDKLDESSDNKLLVERFEWLKSNLKEQWLEFLIECNDHTEVPNRNELIKKGYNIMKLATWDPKDQTLYWKQKQAESDFIKQKEYDKEEAFEHGKWKGEYKGEIGKIKMGIKYDLGDKITNELKYTKDKFIDFKNYFQEHPSQLEADDNESVIMNGMDIEYPADFNN